MRRLAIVLLLVPFLAEALSIEGAVVDTAGSAVPAADVWAIQQPNVVHITTGEDGRFRFDALVTGAFTILARKSGLALGGIDGHAVGDGNITITLGEPDALRLRLINHEYRPIEGARLRSIVVSDQFQVPCELLAQHGFNSIRSDAEGHITVDNLPKGSWVRFTLGHPRYAEENIPYYPVGRDVQTIPMQPGVALQGRVVADGGAALENARVAVFRVTAAGPRTTSEQWSDREGYFTAVLSPGDYFVTATHREFVTTEPLPVLLERDESAVTAKLVLQRAHRVSGAVLYDNGKPASGVTVLYAMRGIALESAITNAKGQYLLKAGGDGVIRVVPPTGYAAKAFSDVAIQKLTGDVTLDPLVLFEIPSVTGTVTGPDGAPVPKAVVATYSTDPPILTTTRDDGSFEVRLTKIPETRTASFFVESAFGFSRGSFDVDLMGESRIDAKLEAYQPAVSYENADRARNNLESLAGKPAPEIACATWVNSEPLSNLALKGKVVVLLLWGGFANDREALLRISEFNLLHDLYKGENDIAIVGVHDAAVTESDFADYIEKYQVRFPVGRDVDAAATFDGFDITYIPQVVLIDKKGVLRFYDTDGRLLELIKVLRREAP